MRIVQENVAPGASRRVPVAGAPAAARLKASVMCVTGSTARKSQSGGTNATKYSHASSALIEAVRRRSGQAVVAGGGADLRRNRHARCAGTQFKRRRHDGRGASGPEMGAVDGPAHGAQEFLGAAYQHREVGADGDPRKAVLEKLSDHVRIGANDATGLAESLAGLCDGAQLVLYGLVSHVARV